MKEYIVLVTKEHYNPLGIVRTLGEAGIAPIVVAVKGDLKFVGQSKYVKEKYYVDSTEEGIELIIDKFANKNEKSFILTGDDVTVAMLDKHYDELKDLRDVIKIENYDIVHVHGSSHTIAIDLFAAKIAKCKNRIAHSHNTTCSSILIHKVLSPFFYLCCTYRLACGIDAGKWMYGQRNFEVINNGVDTLKYIFDGRNRKEIRDMYKLENKVVIGHVGGFNETKNQSFLIDILNHMDKEMFCLMLVGDGPLKNKVHNKAVTLGLENNVIFIGITDYVEKYLSAMDCIVMPSLFEGLQMLGRFQNI